MLRRAAVLSRLSGSLLSGSLLSDALLSDSLPLGGAWA